MMHLPGFKLLTCHHRGHGSHHHSHNGAHHGGGSQLMENQPDHQEIQGRQEIMVERRVLDANDQQAEANRQLFADQKVFVINVMSSPGSGKTTTLVNTIKRLQALQIRCAVIVGDICTRNDADRLATTGVPSMQINTDQFGGDCHLTAQGVQKALGDVDLVDIDLLIVENVGNLVCPAEFDIGENARVVVLSVTEGEDKPLKYPLMFRLCDVALLNKTDLLPYLDFDATAAIANIHQVHPEIPVWPVSAKTGDGFEPWIEWIQSNLDSE